MKILTNNYYSTLEDYILQDRGIKRVSSDYIVFVLQNYHLFNTTNMIHYSMYTYKNA